MNAVESDTDEFCELFGQNRTIEAFFWPHIQVAEQNRRATISVDFANHLDEFFDLFLMFSLPGTVGTSVTDDAKVRPEVGAEGINRAKLRYDDASM
jgi:hypothetical protein